MEYRDIMVVDASDLAYEINRKYGTRWDWVSIRRYGFYDKNETGIRYYYFGNENNDDDVLDEQEIKTVMTLREHFPHLDGIYINLEA